MHQTPDRMPIDLGGTRGTGISAEAYLDLRSYLGYQEEPPYVFDCVQQLAYPDLNILRQFHIDVIDGGQAFRLEKEKCHSWTLNSGREALVPNYFNLDYEGGAYRLRDMYGEQVIAKKEKNELYFTQTYYPYAKHDRIPQSFRPKDLAKNIYSVPIHPWNLNLQDKEEYDVFVAGIRNLYEQTDFAIALTIGCQIFEMGQYLRGMENFLCDMYLDETGSRRLLDALLEKYMGSLEKIVNGVGKYIFTLRFVDDLGSQHGPMIDPKKYRSLIKNYHKTMWDFIHCNSDVKVTLHSCGSVYEYIPDLIEAGVDILNPIQTSARNMDPERLKEEFGDYLVFWGGGCDTQTVLPKASAAEIKAHVKERVEVLADGGGMIFSQIHNIQPDVSPENVIAMLQAAYEYGQY